MASVWKQALAALLLVLATVCAAQQNDVQTTAPSWSALNDTQAELLEPFADSWATLPPQVQRQLYRITLHWDRLPAQRKTAFQEQWSHWRNMNPQRKRMLYAQLRRFAQLSSEQRRRMFRQHERFLQLPAEERQALRDRFAQLTPAQRDALARQLRAGNEASAHSNNGISEQPRSDSENGQANGAHQKTLRHRFRAIARPLSRQQRQVLRSRIRAHEPDQLPALAAQLEQLGPTELVAWLEATNPDESQ